MKWIEGKIGGLTYAGLWDGEEFIGYVGNTRIHLTKELIQWIRK